MRTELEEIERRHSVLMENRHKLEAALRKGEQNMRSIETRMRAQAKEPQQIQVIELLSVLAKQQAERAAIHSDFAIQSRRLRRQESAFKQLRRYERVADLLIGVGGEKVDGDEERSQLFREYRILRSQLSKLLEQNSINNGIPSWNAQILERLNNGERNIINNTSKTVNNGKRRDSESPPTMSHFGETFIVSKQNNNQRNDIE